VIVVTFQSAFHAEMHQNDVFFVFLNYFLNQRIKTIQNIQKKILIFSKTEIEFFENAS
jgi:hypothetical protein